MKNWIKKIKNVDRVKKLIFPGYVSQIIETNSFYDSKEPKYLNQVILFETNKEPLVILSITKLIEKLIGKNFNKNKNSPRIIDIDIIAIDEVVLDFVDLKIPHPLMHERSFVLGPLLEVCPNWSHPLTGKSLVEMLNEID